MTRHPDPIVPMKASVGPLPTQDGWAFEIKWDGMRIVASIDPDADPPVRLTSSTAKDATGRFGELQELRTATGGVPAVLDGEAVVLDAQGRSDFGGLQARVHADGVSPVRYMVFDVLAINGASTMTLPLRERRRLLDELLTDNPRWSISTMHDGDGQPLLDAATGQGLEGLVAKQWDSIYRPGSRSKAWRKIKIRRRQEFVVGGWTAGEGNRSNTLGSLLIGHHDDVGLRFAGRVGTGFTQKELERLLALLRPLEQATSPFVELPGPIARTATFVQPTLVVEVEFAEWTSDGVLRHPAYAGQRDDVDPTKVIREPHPGDR